MEKIFLKHIQPLPKCPKGFHLATHNISLKNELLSLYVEKQAKPLVHKFVELVGWARFPESSMGNDFKHKLLISDNEIVSESDIPASDIAFPMVDIFSDGSIALIGSRCRWHAENDYDLNGMIFNPNSNVAHRFLAGDGISHIGVDGMDRIWLSYFDEGVYGNFGWGDKNSPPPIGQHGLICFDRNGDISWKCDQLIDDCYALNVTPDKVHFYYYSDFDLGTVSENFETSYRSTSLSGCHTFAINERFAAFTKQYDDQESVINIASLTDNECKKIRFKQLTLPNDEPIKGGRLMARNNIIHYLDDHDWYQWELPEEADKIKIVL